MLSKEVDSIMERVDKLAGCIEADRKERKERERREASANEKSDGARFAEEYSRKLAPKSPR